MNNDYLVYKNHEVLHETCRVKEGQVFLISVGTSFRILHNEALALAAHNHLGDTEGETSDYVEGEILEERRPIGNDYVVVSERANHDQSKNNSENEEIEQ